MAVEPLVIHADLELHLTTRFRALLAARPEPVCAGVVVSNAWKDVPKLLVVRFDGATRTSVITADASIGLSIAAGTKANPKDAIDLARIVAALIPALVEPRSPVAGVVETNEPIPVPDADPRAIRYISGVLAVVGSALP